MGGPSPFLGRAAGEPPVLEVLRCESPQRAVAEDTRR